MIYVHVINPANQTVIKTEIENNNLAIQEAAGSDSRMDDVLIADTGEHKYHLFFRDNYRYSDGEKFSVIDFPVDYFAHSCVLVCKNSEGEYVDSTADNDFIKSLINWE